MGNALVNICLLISIARVGQCSLTCPDLENCDKPCLGFLKDSNNCAICECDEETEMMGDIKMTSLTRGYMNAQLRTESYLKLIEAGVQFDASTAKIPKWYTYPTKKGIWRIPFVIDESIDKTGRQAIKAAIKDFEEFICLNFVKRVRDEENYLFFQDDGTGCWSYVGRRIGEKNTIGIGSGCRTKGIVIHEIMHALGFFHEQQRPDRDQYITVHWANIKTEFISNFRKKTRADVDSLGSPYDIGSVMHYSDMAFSKNNERTITTKDGEPFEAQREKMSEADIQQLRLMYKCPGATVQPPPTEIPISKPTTKPLTISTPVTTLTSPLPPLPTTTMAPPPETSMSPEVEETTALPTDEYCMDLNPECKHLAQLGLCTNSWYRLQAKEECEKTCEFCGCDDYYDSCSIWAAAGDCTTPDTHYAMMEECPLSCGYCGKACRDLDNDCESLAEYGLCNDEESVSYMVNFCPKTCGLCYITGEIVQDFNDEDSWF